MRREIASVVLSCQRGVDYLTGTLASVRAAGFDPLVVWDGPDRVSMPGIGIGKCHHMLARCGVRAAFRRALELVYYSKYLVVFQDDILVAKGLRDWLDGDLPEGVLSLYTASPHDSPADGWRALDLDPDGKDHLPWHRSLGACALMLRREDAIGFLKNEPQFVRTDRLGAAVGEWCYRSGAKFWVHSPSLVQHIGERSVLSGVGITDDRRAARFCGDVSGQRSAFKLEAPLPHP